MIEEWSQVGQYTVHKLKATTRLRERSLGPREKYFANSPPTTEYGAVLSSAPQSRTNQTRWMLPFEGLTRQSVLSYRRPTSIPAVLVWELLSMRRCRPYRPRRIPPGPGRHPGSRCPCPARWEARTS